MEFGEINSMGTMEITYQISRTALTSSGSPMVNERAEAIALYSQGTEEDEKQMNIPKPNRELTATLLDYIMKPFMEERCKLSRLTYGTFNKLTI